MEKSRQPFGRIIATIVSAFCVNRENGGSMVFNNASKQSGFTLIELMIVVGIIGILVAIAAPNFSRYQSKARQSEAKIALAAVFGAEKSFHGEYSAYISSMDAIGYAPEGQRRYYDVGWNAVHGSAVTGYGGVNTTANFAATNNPFTCTNNTATLASNLTGDAQSFTVSARGCIRNGSANMDTWNITDAKVISNNEIAL